MTAQIGGLAASYRAAPEAVRFTLANSAPALIEIAATPALLPMPRASTGPMTMPAAATATQYQAAQQASYAAVELPHTGDNSAVQTNIQGSGTGQTQFFGVPGRGSRLVYVFDRSASMEGARLAAAKQELIASLLALDGRHQFQVVGYNQRPEPMLLPSGRAGSLVAADERGKRQAEQFIRGIYAEGPTHHMPALELALQMQPDVIYFLTDADEPQLSRDELQRIRSQNRKAVIHTIEFGAGQPAGRFNFLRQLAAENGGQHAYVDVRRFVR